MFTIDIEHKDLEKIKSLNDKLPLIKELNSIKELKNEPLKKINAEIKFIYKNETSPTRGKKNEQKKLFKLYEESNLAYLNEFNNWNIEMSKIMKKYNYIKLRDFLFTNPLPITESNVTQKFAFNIYALARATDIPILRELYTPEPKFVNNYPYEWLKSIYLKANEFKTEPADLRKFKL